ncbi:Sequence-specific DNA binding transcription factor [Rhynchospora pubera]|uniref:Sequence-specific DNA binding transcription factor n=1 Tax=Rhynchospora pubera TaxID=906938 RepID=A0AAV8GFT1_9POAL|nr:Sequence-specific DNA binding transcription factor [Rhynchospora pubera]
MEGNIPSGSMMQGAGSYGVLDLQNTMQIPHHHHHHHHHHLQQSNTNPSPNFAHPGLSAAGFTHQLSQIPESSDQHSGIPFMDYGKNGSGMDNSKTPVSDEDEAVGPTDEGTGPGHGTEKGGKKGAGTPWQRMKWTDGMVKLLITAVSYTGEDTGPECGSRRKFTVLQKKGKWKAISKVMGERGCYVSPQQCEDKFNDLNKRYKRLTDILGRGTSCKVVENPVLLEQMDLSDKVKDDVRKILSSKHLFYEEMCSYHNGNRINLPADPALQKALQLALRNREEADLTKRGFSGEVDEEEHSMNSEEDDEEDDLHENDMHAYPPKRTRDDNACCGNSSYGNSGGHGGRPDINQALFEGGPSCGNMSCGASGEQALELERKKLHLQAQSLELERQRFKWERFSKKKDRELQRMKMQNERMRLENERMALELKHKELDLDVQMKRGSL